jgi:hypothetical protein
MPASIVSADVSGSPFTLFASQGVFSGRQRVAETASLPGDPDNSSRDDQVFPGGSMHIVASSWTSRRCWQP